MASAIEVRNLTKKFGKHSVAVDDLSFAVQPGRICGFLGPNGAGKTTTIRALLGLLAPTSGSTTIMGRSYRELDDPVRTVGATLETAGFHPGRSARNHLRYVTTASGIPTSRADEVLELVGLESAARTRVGKFSMGMKQRLALASALLADPQVLLLDEPTNGLDPIGMRWLRDFLRGQAAQGKTILVSSHGLLEVEQTVDEVVIINKGKLVLEATMEDLRATAGGGTRVRARPISKLREAVEAAGFQHRRGGRNEIIVMGATTDDVGQVAARNGVAVLELAEVNVNLERVFLDLVGPPVAREERIEDLQSEADDLGALL